MQLQSLAKSTEALNSITKILNNTQLDSFQKITQLEIIGKSYSQTVLKQAIAQSSLNKEQIRAILSANGLQGEILETTAEEWANVASTNAVAAAQKGATTSTGGLSAAFKGLGISLKTFAVSHPILIALTALTAITIGVAKSFEYFDESLKEAQEKAENAKAEYDEIAGELSELNSELETTQNRIAELQKLADAGTITLVEENELNKLREHNNELEREIELKEYLAQVAAKEASDAAVKAINKESTDLATYGGVPVYDETGSQAYRTESRPETLSRLIDEATAFKEEMYSYEQQMKKIEAQYGNDAEKYAIDSTWKELDKKYKNTEKYVESLEKEMTGYYNSLSSEDDALRDQYGNIVEGAEDTVGKLNTVYNKMEIYSQGGRTAVDKLSDYFNDSINNSTIESLKNAYEQFSNGEIDKQALQSMSEYKEILDKTGISVSGLIKYLGDLKKQTSNSTPDTSTSKSFAEAWSALDNTEDDTLKNTKKELLELAESGTLTANSLKEVEGAKTYFESIGLSAEQTAKKINTIVEETKPLASLQKGISSIQTAFKEKKDDKSVSAETFSSMSDTFGNLKLWDNYKKVLGSTTSTLKECKKAQNELVTEWVNSNNFLSQLGESNKDYYISLLKNMGITNASVVVEEKLSTKRQVNKLKAEALTVSEKDLGTATSNNTEEFLKQAKATDGAKIALAELVAQEAIFKASTLSAEDKVKELNKIAEAYFNVSAGISLANVSGMGQDPRYSKPIEDQWNEYIKKIRKKLNTNIEIDPTKPDDKDKKDKEDKKSKETFDWIEKKIEFIQGKLDTLKSKFENLFTYNEKKNNLNKQLKRTNDLLTANEKAADKYYKKAGKVRLSDSLKKKVREGDYDITKYGEKTANKINKYADYIGKARDAENNTITLKTDKIKIKDDIFQLDIQEYERAIELIENKAEDINGKIEKIETAGSRVGASYYNSLKANNENTKKLYEDELTFLEKHLKTVKKGSDEWYETNSTIQEVKQSIEECNKKALEFNKNIIEIRHTSWENANEQLGHVIDEHSFIAELSEIEKNFDPDTGLMTDAGLLKLGVSAVDKKIYEVAAAEDTKYLDELLAQREEYERTGNLGTWNSIESLNTEIDTVYSAWQDNIEAVGQKNKEIADMMTEQYNSMLDVVNELIDAKQEELSAEKDLRDYQRQVSEQTNDINTIEKQIAAYRGNTSQEAQAKLQQLELQRQEAVKALQETEEDRAFSDMSDMLTKMGEEYSELIAKKIDDFKTLVEEGMEIANVNSTAISESMERIAGENGYIPQYATRLNELPSEIAALINDSYRTENTTVSQSNMNTESQGGTSSNNSGESNATSGKTTLLDTALKYVENHLNKAKKDKEDLSDVNKRFYKQYNGKVLSVDEMKKLSEKLGIEYDGAKKTGNLYKKLKKIKFPGFSRGGVVVDDIDKVLKANGDDTIGTLKVGERVLTPVQNTGFETLMRSDLVSNPSIAQNIAKMSKIPEFVKNNSQITQHNDIALSLTLPNVVDSKSLIKEVKTNKTLQNALQTAVVNPMLGKPIQDVKHIH